MTGGWLVFAVALAAVCLGEPSWSPYLAPVGVLVTCAFVARYRHVSIASLSSSVHPRTVVAAVVAAAVLAALVASVTQLPHVLTSAHDTLAHPTGGVAAQDIEPLGSYGSVPAIAAAARTIPPGAAYGVDYGAHYAVPWLFQFWLSPRVYTYPFTAAPWIIVYREPLPVALRTRKRIVLAPRVYLIEPPS